MQTWETAPDWVQQAVDQCLHDMQQPTAIDVPLDWVVRALFPEPEDGGDEFAVFDADHAAELVSHAQTYCKNTPSRSQKVRAPEWGTRRLLTIRALN
ncbi:hypothetical protein DVA67_032735 [Solirubrobacter sp. CPCC 204708]|uniref:Uncharacterized protein n=1 Tax=Solirubrobacter deserti TaxID=2282478 RepID=A0ABT4RTT8_9ACTN|nr:hypothetical protein [Solirubrobacter deserti]MBE2320772.1 hypothetical protein [Solirubrobacter deserti]MDA0141875.1 hypothetical protein [Solirubrobacter deserti]